MFLRGEVVGLELVSLRCCTLKPAVISEMAAAHTCLPFGMPLYDVERYHLLEFQNDQFVSWFESQTWLVKVERALFEDGQYFLHLHVLNGVALRLMDESIWPITCCEDMPIHNTLGFPREPVDENQSALMVKGEHTLTVNKWSWDRTSSTYLPQGSLHSLLS